MVHIEVHDGEDVPAAAEITAGFLAHMIEAVGPWPRVPLTLLLRDDAGSVCGGIRAIVALCWLQIEQLWVDCGVRGQGHGSRLLHRAEEEARARNAIGSQLTTCTFQAIGFTNGTAMPRLGGCEIVRQAKTVCGWRRDGDKRLSLRRKTSNSWMTPADREFE